MAKAKKQYACQSCGTLTFQWAGKCADCGAWNSLIEENSQAVAPKGIARKDGNVIDFVALKGESAEVPRVKSAISEFDRVCGGGLVAGSALLIGGDPGVGKSTLVLQLCARLSSQVSCAYISGEEAIGQIRLRAKRLGVEGSSVSLASATNMKDILATLDTQDPPGLVVIDSIQTMYSPDLDAAPGTVSQVRVCALEIIRLAKLRGFVVFIVGHVTKEGMIAGPRILEHMVDTVLYFEGDRGHQFRLLRAVKNRFGPVNEIGVFEMTQLGLQEVTNPSELFLGQRQEKAAGTSVFAGIDGTRPVLVEIQALLAASPLPSPRRTVVGWDSGRLSMVMAVLEARCGLNMGARDVYLNVAGGYRVQEPAADLAVAAALVSSFLKCPLENDAVFLGEIGLSAEVRPVSQMSVRVKEAQKLGFKKVYAPINQDKKDQSVKNAQIQIVPVNTLQQLIDFIRS